MSDLISRKEAIDAIEFEKVYMTAYKGNSNGYVSEGNPLKQYNKGLDDAIKAINSLAPAEPERKKGEWLVQPSTGDDRPNIWWKCSVCGHVVFSETERDRKEFHAFCGRCGADMRGE